MNPFEPIGPEVPPPPLEIPTPEIPAANFLSVGGQVAKGATDSGFWSDFWSKLLDIIPAIVGKIIGALLTLILKILAYLYSILNQVWANAEGGSDSIAAQAVSGLFGVSASSGSFTSVVNRGQRQQTAADITQAVLGALGAAAPSGGQSSLQPSATAVNTFLQTATHLSVEGWLQGWLFEAVSAGQIETFTQLKDIIAHSLGLGRIAHTVMGPALTTLAVDPYKWLLNSTYRPKLLTEIEAVRALSRGLITRDEMNKQLAYQGYTDANIELAINLNTPHLPPAALEELVLHGFIDDATALQKLKAQGYDDWTGNAALNVARFQRVDRWLDEIVREAVNAYGARKLDQATFEGVVNQSGLPGAEKQLLLQLGQLKQQVNIKRPPLAEVAQMVEQGTETLDYFREIATFEGYQPSDELNLELFLLKKVSNLAQAAEAKKQAAAQKAERAKEAAQRAADKAKAAAAAAESKGISVVEYQNLVKLGLKTIDNYRAYLLGKGIAPDNVDALVTVLQAQLNSQVRAQQLTGAANLALKAKNLSLAQLAAAAKAGIITPQEYQARLLEAGVSQADAEILLQLVEDEIQTAAAKAAAAANKKTAAATKGLDLAQEETGVELGIKTMSDYQAFLKAKGYDQSDIATLSSELQAKIDKLKAAAAAKAGIAAKAGARGLNLAQLERLVRTGAKTIDDYSAALATLGYGKDAISDLVTLLQLQMTADKQQLAASGRAAALIGQRGLSLAEISNAVALGVIPMSVYTATLTEAGLNADDVHTLQLALAAKIAAKRKTTAATPNAAKLVSEAGLSLPALEKDVLAGRLTVTQLDALLESAHVTADEIAAINQLLNDQAANEAALRQLVGNVAAAAKAKTLSLAEETAAVKAGVKTLADYSAFVASLGFNAADVATLTETLAVALGKKTPSTPAAPLPPTSVLNPPA